MPESESPMGTGQTLRWQCGEGHACACGDVQPTSEGPRCAVMADTDNGGDTGASPRPRSAGPDRREKGDDSLSVFLAWCLVEEAADCPPEKRMRSRSEWRRDG